MSTNALSEMSYADLNVLVIALGGLQTRINESPDFPKTLLEEENERIDRLTKELTAAALVAYDREEASFVFNPD
jgi:hypothetical protein